MAWVHFTYAEMQEWLEDYFNYPTYLERVEQGDCEVL